MYCTPCADKVFIQGQKGTAEEKQPEKPATAKSTPPIKSTPPVKSTPPPPAAAAPAQPATTVRRSEQTFDSDFPAELKGWNWGAFVFSWIWGIINKVWISFLVFIPFLNIVWVFVLGAKGSEWAWKAREWDSIEHFKKHQKAWRPWAILLFILWIIGIVLYLIFIIVMVVIMGGEIYFG
jgi:hypothetical protein